MQIAAIQVVEQMLQSVGVRPVFMSYKLKVQRVLGIWQLFYGALKEPSQLLDLKQAAFHA
ncbi:hypothetical protein D3C77_729730 [compost metagenome]